MCCHIQQLGTHIGLCVIIILARTQTQTFFSGFDTLKNKLEFAFLLGVRGEKKLGCVCGLVFRPGIEPG